MTMVTWRSPSLSEVLQGTAAGLTIVSAVLGFVALYTKDSSSTEKLQDLHSVRIILDLSAAGFVTASIAVKRFWRD